MADLAIQTPQDFAQALLAGLGAPQTQQNVDTVTGWEQHEGGNWHNSAAFNPLNTTLHEPGSIVMPGGGPGAGAGVQAYTSWAQGLQATLDTLLGRSSSGATIPGAPSTRYATIVADLRANLPAATVAADVRASPWGTEGWFPSGTPGPSAPPSTSPVSPVDQHIPGTPWNVPTPNDILGGAAGVGADAAKAVLSWLAKPLEMVALVGLGIVIVVVGLIVLAKAAGNDVSSSGGGGGNRQQAPREEGAGEEAAAAG